MFELVAFFIAMAGVCMLVGGSVIAWTEQDWNNIGVIGVCLMVLGLLLLK